MKHLKIYEQFDVLDPFGEEVSYNNKNLKMKVVRYKLENNKYFIIQDMKEVIYFFKDNRYTILNLDNFELNPILDDDCMIYVCDSDKIYPEGDVDYRKNPKWKCYLYKNLPQEIKDKIIV